MDIILVRQLIKVYSTQLRAYYDTIGASYMDIFILLIITHLEAYNIRPDVNKAQDMMYNKNIDGAILILLAGGRARYERTFTSNVIGMATDGKTLGQLFEYIDRLIFDEGRPKNNLLSTYRTEYTRIRGSVKQFIVDEYESQGFTVKKHWLYTYESTKARESHLAFDGEIADKDGYFTINGKRTLAPGHFNDPSEDINCMCDMYLEIKSTDSKRDDDGL